jgi:RNA polymerase sigma-70 factor (ECF subfamily)
LLRSQPLYAVADHADSVAGQLDVAAAFEQLSDIDQEVLRLALWERLIAKDAAAVLGCTTATFQVKLHRARRRLRKILEKTPNSPSDNVDHRPIRKEKRGGIDA